MGGSFAGTEHGMMNLKDTELCLGLPGGGGGGGGESCQDGIKSNGKRVFCVDLKLKLESNESDPNRNVSAKVPIDPPPSKSQVVGWPPVRSSRKNLVMGIQKKSEAADEGLGGTAAAAAAFVKVSMDGAPYLRKVDLRMYKSYDQLSNALAKMFTSFTIIEYVGCYEDEDGDWMLMGDVPWEMFFDSCKRLRIMKGSEAVLGRSPRSAK